MASLTWISLYPDEVAGAQWAESNLGPLATWEIGPAFPPGVWACEMVQHDPDGTECMEGSLNLGCFPSEADAKRAATSHEPETA